MWKIFIILFFQTISYSKETTSYLSKKELEQHFKNMRIENNNLTFIQLDSPRRLIQIGDDITKAKLSEAMSTIVLPLGISFQMVERHSGIEFKPLPGSMKKSGYEVVSYSDTRSIGGKLETKKAILIFLKSEKQIPEVYVIEPDLEKAKAILASKPIISIKSEENPEGGADGIIVESLEKPSGKPKKAKEPESAPSSAPNSEDLKSTRTPWLPLFVLIFVATGGLWFSLKRCSKK